MNKINITARLKKQILKQLNQQKDGILEITFNKKKEKAKTKGKEIKVE